MDRGGGSGATIDLSCLEADAASRLESATFDYVRGGAGDSVAANVAAWELLRFRPHMLGDVALVSTATTVLGLPTAAPIMVAPTAMHRLVCPDGECATSRAAAMAGLVYVVSMAATTPVEEIAAAAPPGARWMQAYVRRDRGLTRASLERAAAAGCQAVVLTVDSPGDPSALDRPGPSGRSLNNGLPLPNLAPEEDTPDVLTVAADYAADLTFAELSDIRAWTGLPLVVKGILRGDDAARCIDAGADAIAVSNHGGRQIPGCVSTATALPEIVDAVAGRGEVYVDGGIRSGADVLKALALGATAVMVGRPVLWGLAIAGETGAAAVLDQLRANLARTMALCGVREVGAVPRDLLCAA